MILKILVLLLTEAHHQEMALGKLSVSVLKAV